VILQTQNTVESSFHEPEIRGATCSVESNSPRFNPTQALIRASIHRL
jgi:hypothetical protein